MSKNIRLFVLLAILSTAIVSCEITRTVSEDDTPVSGDTVYELYAPQSDMDKAFNIVFVPDDSYGDLSVLANRQDFVDDMTDVIENAYWQNRAYFNGFLHFNYYYMTETGDVQARSPDVNGNFRCPTVTWPAGVNTDAAFADQLILIHQNNLRDCGGGGRATAEPTSYRTIVHETGHGLFGLPDEYCCDSTYSEVKPVLYATESACKNDPDNSAWRNCVSLTSSRDGSTWWRSQGDITNNLIMRNAGTEVWESGPADWFIMEEAYQSLGSSQVSTPDVFAPDRWDYDVPPAP
ncbi:hypothetical protein [Marinimicrobium agarilyticum]|uniref:hypothetical protein n=1 Tax=Marinimicrobium agarilyticum TaxID=306546 RepID=UPI0003FBFB56|nr:hypothetical protein [Marinimicrobium agarilyticum]